MPLELSPQWIALAGLNLVACLLFVAVELAGLLRGNKRAAVDDRVATTGSTANDGASFEESGTDEWWREWAESGGSSPAAADSCRSGGGAGRGGWVA